METPLPHIIPLLAASVGCGVLSILALRMRPAGGAGPLAGLMAVVAWWCLFYAAEIGAFLGHQLLWVRLEYIAIVSVSALNLLFAVQYQQQALRFSRPWLLLLVEPVAVATIVWFEPGLGWIWESVAPGLGLETIKAPGFWVHTAYSYVLLLAGFGILLSRLRHASGLYWHQRVAIWIACLSPWVANLIYLTELSPFPGLDLTPFAFVLTGAGLAWGLMRHDLLRLGPLAHRQVTNSIDDGILVLDASDRVVDANPAAQSLLPARLDELVGRSVLDLLPAWQLNRIPDDAGAQVSMRHDSGESHYEVTGVPVYNRRGKPRGRVLLFYDVTEIRRRDAVRTMLQDLRDQLWKMEQSSDFPEILVALTKALRDLPFEYDHCGLNLVQPDDDDGGPRFFTMALDRRGRPVTATDDVENPEVLAQIVRQGQVSYRPDLTAGAFPETEAVTDAFGSVRSIVDVPFSGGTLALNSHKPHVWSTDDISVLERVAAVLSEAYMRQRDLQEREENLLELQREVESRRRTEVALRQAKEEAEVANRAKSDFLSNISHELRTPMNAILGMTDLVLETDLTAAQRTYLQTSRRSSDQLLNLLNSLLDFARIERGAVELESAPFSLRECVSGALQVLAPRAHEIGLELCFHVASDIDDLVVGDVARLRQVLMNLAGNAIKFTTQGEVEILVTQEAIDRHDVTLRFDVRDTGPGIPAERQAAIFEPFTQADVSTTRTHGGSGLGLTICRELVHRMQGRIWLTSASGEGSTFHFVVKFTRCEDPTPAPTTAVHGTRCLVIEQHETHRLTLMDILQDLGAVCIGVESPMEAITACESQSFDTLLVGATAADAADDGLDFLREVSGAQLIVVTTFDGLDAWSRHEQSGSVAAVWTRPISAAQVRASFGEGRQATDDPANPARQRQRVLLVDDTQANQVYASTVLRKRGYDVSVAGDGVEALELLGGDQVFDIVLMDVHMPRMGGVEATEQMRQLGGWREQVPVIALTADITHVDSSAMDGHLTKPFTPERLIATVEHAGTRAQVDDGAAVSWSPASALDAVEGDRQLLEELAQIIARDCPTRLEELRRHVEQREPEGTEKSAHALNNLLGLLGAHPSMAPVRTLENLARDGEEPERWPSLLADIEGQVDTFINTLKRIGHEGTTE